MTKFDYLPEQHDSGKKKTSVIVFESMLVGFIILTVLVYIVGN